MIDKFSGQVAYAVMSFGGFLGIGERHHPLPWGALTYDTKLGGYVVDLGRERLEGAPSYGRDEAPWGPAEVRGEGPCSSPRRHWQRRSRRDRDLSTRPHRAARTSRCRHPRPPGFTHEISMVD